MDIAKIQNALRHLEPHLSVREAAVEAEFLVRAVNAHEALVEALEISVDLLSEELKHSHQKQPHHHTLTYGLNQARAALKLARGEE